MTIAVIQKHKYKDPAEDSQLIVDDDELVRETFLTWVSHTFPTLEVEVAATLEQVAQSSRNAPSPVAVITDYDLGDFDAMDVWEVYRDHWGQEKANEDIVVVSGLEREDIGAMAFIGKGNLQTISVWIEERFY